jgi:hypothetical protein
MSPFRKSIAVAAALVAAGCASSPPSPEELSRIPVVRFGETVPTGKDYVLFFPPDQPIPMEVAVKGNIFAKEAEQHVDVTLRRGIYAYKEWVSYDRVTWKLGRETIKGNIQIMIPSYKHPEPGRIRIQMDERG